jgi:hypothetical protein
VVAGPVTPDLAVLLGTGTGQLAAPRRVAGRGGRDLAVGDFNADGRLDAALAAYPKRPVTVRLGIGDGTFGPARRFGAVEDAAEAVTSADLNHDGTLDLAVAFYQGLVSVLLGNGDGTFAAQREYAMRFPATAVVTADFDGDGNADIATSGYTTAPLTVRLGRGDGTFQERQSLPSFSAYSDALLNFVADGTVADFNVDGRSDIAVITGHGELTTSTTSVLLNWTGLPAPPCIVVPIAREHVRRAKRHLENAGCRVRHVRYDYSRKLRKGLVISQRPRHGPVLVTHAGVDLVVSRGRRR